MMMRLTIATLLAFFLPSSLSQVDGQLKELPETGEEWISLDERTEFLPASSVEQPLLRQAQRRFLAYTDNFVDSDTYYDEYSQAWRVLGWYIDCQANQNDHHDRRKTRHLEGDDGYDDDGYEVNAYCQRYILWAAVSTVQYISVESCWCKHSSLTQMTDCLSFTSTLT